MSGSLKMECNSAGMDDYEMEKEKQLTATGVSVLCTFAPHMAGDINILALNAPRDMMTMHLVKWRRGLVPAT